MFQGYSEANRVNNLIPSDTFNFIMDLRGNKYIIHIISIKLFFLAGEQSNKVQSYSV